MMPGRNNSSARHVFYIHKFLCQQLKRMIQIHTPIPPLRIGVLHILLSSGSSLQIIFHTASRKKRLIVPYDRPFKQRTPNAPLISGAFTFTPGAARWGVTIPEGVYPLPAAI